MKDKIVKTVLLIISALGIIVMGYKLYIYIKSIPLKNEIGSMLEIIVTMAAIMINIIGSFLYMKWVKILSSFAVTLGIYNILHGFLLIKLLPKYVNIVADAKSYIHYTAKGAVTSYRIFLITVIAIFIVFWIKYTQVIQHRMEEI